MQYKTYRIIIKILDLFNKIIFFGPLLIIGLPMEIIHKIGDWWIFHGEDLFAKIFGWPYRLIQRQLVKFAKWLKKYVKDAPPTYKQAERDIHNSKIAAENSKEEIVE